MDRSLRKVQKVVFQLMTSEVTHNRPRRARASSPPTIAHPQYHTLRSFATIHATRGENRAFPRISIDV